MDDLQTELNAIRSKKLKFIYIFNNSNTEKKKGEAIKATLCTKLLSEFKYNLISFSECVKEEISNVNYSST
jgi:hypothetical protein